MKNIFDKRNVALTAMVAAIVLFSWWLGPHHELMSGWIQRAGWWGPLLAILFFMLLSLTPVPADPLSVAAVVLYGPWMGFLISWMGNNAAAMTEYIVAKNVESTLKVDYHTLPSIFKNNRAYLPILLR